MKNQIILFLSLIIFSACELENIVEIEIPPHKSVLVLNGNLNPDSVIQVLITNSVGAFSQETPTSINNANVLLYENNNLIGPLIKDTINPIYVNFWTDKGADSVLLNYYKINYFPKRGYNYKIIVNHPDYESIEAETSIPENIIIYNIEIDSSSEDITEISFTFNDNVDLQNYYQLELDANCSKTWFEYEYGIYDEYFYTNRIFFYSNDPSFPGGFPFSGYTFEGESVIFTDAIFNGSSKKIEIDIPSEDFDFTRCDSLIIKFSSFNYETFDYFNSLSDHIDKGALGIFGGEVIPVYSNVKNGLGVLISANEQKEYIIK
tara:strand:- start:9347 stop:10303 length:957 start_codon:yes stop_codon:yes gene_type:complete